MQRHPGVLERDRDVGVVALRVRRGDGARPRITLPMSLSVNGSENRWMLGQKNFVILPAISLNDRRSRPVVGHIGSSMSCIKGFSG